MSRPHLVLLLLLEDLFPIDGIAHGDYHVPWTQVTDTLHWTAKNITRALPGCPCAHQPDYHQHKSSVAQNNLTGWVHPDTQVYSYL
jgi:hypothetical protein